MKAGTSPIMDGTSINNMEANTEKIKIERSLSVAKELYKKWLMSMYREYYSNILSPFLLLFLLHQCFLYNTELNNKSIIIKILWHPSGSIGYKIL